MTCQLYWELFVSYIREFAVLLSMEWTVLQALFNATEAGELLERILGLRAAVQFSARNWTMQSLGRSEQRSNERFKGSSDYVEFDA